MKKVFLMGIIIILSSCNLTPTTGINEEMTTNTYYFSTAGDDNNSGFSPDQAKASLELMSQLNGSADHTIFKIEEGMYILSDRILITNFHFSILGGFDSSFENITGYSIFNGNGDVPPLFVHNVENSEILNIAFINGYSNESYSPLQHYGVIFGKVNNSKISNIIVSNHQVKYAGVYFDDSHGNYIQGSFQKNLGHGLNMNNSSHNIIDGAFIMNGGCGFAVQNACDYNIFTGFFNNNSGRGVNIYNSDHNTVTGDVYSNRDGGVTLYWSENNTLNGDVFYNVEPNGNGGGVYIWGGNNTINGNVFGNKSINGGGLYIGYEYNVINGYICSNIATHDGGGLSIFGGNSGGNSATVVNGAIFDNVSSNYGGGIYMEISDNNIFNGPIEGNYSIKGGGVYALFSDLNEFNANITFNNASQGGGIFYTHCISNFMNATNSFNSQWGVFSHNSYSNFTYSFGAGNGPSNTYTLFL